MEGSADRESARVTIQFVFPSKAAFQGWYRSPAARELIALLRRIGTIQHFQLGVKRYPLAGMLPPG